MSLAILGDDRPEWRPDEYVRGRFRCEEIFRFRTVKLLDWKGREQELLDNPSPIALVILAHLYSLETHHRPEERRRAKWRASIRQLFERGWTPESIRQVYRLVDWFLELPAQLDMQLKRDLRTYEEERHMPYVTSLERMGREEGLKEGQKEGRAAMLDIVVQVALESKYGEAGAAFARELHAVVDFDTIRKISPRGASRIEDHRRVARNAAQRSQNAVSVFASPLRLNRLYAAPIISIMEALPPADARLRQIQALLSVTESITRHQDLPALFHDLVQRLLRRSSRSTFCWCCCTTLKTRRCAWHILESLAPDRATGRPLVTPIESPGGLVYQTQEPLAIADFDQEIRFPQMIPIWQAYQ